MTFPNLLEYLVILCFNRQYLQQISPTKYCCSPKIRHFDPYKILGWLCHCARKYLNSCHIWVRLVSLWTKDEYAADSKPSLESFQRGALRLCGGAWYSENWQKLHWYTVVFHVPILGLGAVMPTKAPPWRRDWADCGEKLNKLQSADHTIFSYKLLWTSAAHVVTVLKRRH